MSKAGESIIAGLNDALAYANGDTSRGRAHRVQIPDAVNVRTIRQRLGLTQEMFAKCYGFQLSSVRNWEQGRRQPEGPTRILLTIIDKEPEAVHRALAS